MPHKLISTASSKAFTDYENADHSPELAEASYVLDYVNDNIISDRIAKCSIVTVCDVALAYLKGELINSSNDGELRIRTTAIKYLKDALRGSEEATGCQCVCGLKDCKSTK